MATRIAADNVRRTLGLASDIAGVVLLVVVFRFFWTRLTGSAPSPVIWLCYPLVWATQNQTFGQSLAGIYVVRADDRGTGIPTGGIGFGPALARTFGYYLCLLTLGIGFFYGLHDRIAGTKVVYLGPPAPVAASPPVAVPFVLPREEI